MDFVTKVMAAIKEGDEEKVKKFKTKLLKAWKEQINARKNEIEKLNEKAQDNEEAVNEVLVQVDMSEIKTNESANNYVEVYTLALGEALGLNDEIAEEIAVLEKEIKKFETLIAKISE